MIKLTPKSMEVFEYVKEHDDCLVADIAEALGRTSASVNANINNLVKVNLVMRNKIEVEGEKKLTTKILLTEAGKTEEVALKDN